MVTPEPHIMWSSRRVVLDTGSVAVSPAGMSGPSQNAGKWSQTAGVSRGMKEELLL